jgi:hypothetical protein
MLGRHHSEESKRKMSAKRKGKFSLGTGFKIGNKLGCRPRPDMKGKKFFLGHSHSEESKKKMSIARLGRKLSLDTRRKLSESHRGSRAYNWKGGKYSDSYRDRRRFRSQMQRTVLERDNYTCQICGQRGKRLQVDHIQPWSEYIEQRFSLDNCRTLCMACHYRITFGKPMPLDTKVWGHNFKEVA